MQTEADSDNSFVIRASDATNVVTANRNGNTMVSGNVSAQQASLISSDADNLQLIIARTGGSWFLGEYLAPETNSGCLVKYKTASGEWWHGVWGTNTNEIKTWFNYKRLTIKPTGDTTISGNLNVGQNQAQTKIKAYANHIGVTSSIN